MNLWLVWNLLLSGGATGRNDFLSFYAGATLAATPDLYDRAKISEVQLRAIGETGDSQKFVRLPCYAMFLKPLAWLPYRTAYLVWELLSATALAAALWLWPHSPPRTKWLAVCWTLPIYAGLLIGQDDTFVLFWIALSARLMHRKWPMAAGVAMALAASKYHLIVLVALVIVAQKRWRMAAGAAIGGCALLALSFALAGPDWPWRYFAVLADPSLVIDVRHMPGLWGSFQQMRFGLQFQILAAIVVAAVVFPAARLDPSFERPMALALVGGILISVHVWLADCSLLLPAIMISVYDKSSSMRLPAALMMVLVPWFVLQFHPPIPVLTRALIVWLLLAGLVHCERLARRGLSLQSC